MRDAVIADSQSVDLGSREFFTTTMVRFGADAAQLIRQAVAAPETLLVEGSDALRILRHLMESQDQANFAEYLGHLRAAGADVVGLMACMETYRRQQDMATAEAKDRSAGRDRSADLGIRPLGYDDDSDTYYFFSALTETIVAIKTGEMKPAKLRQLATPETWIKRFPKFSKSDALNGPTVNWEEAAAYIQAISHSLPLYNPATLRGLGATRDGDNIVVHLGSSLLVNGQSVALADYESPSGYMFTRRTEAAFPANQVPASTEQLAAIHDLIVKFGWEDAFSGHFTAGYLLLAPFAGVLNWRPHLYITAPQGSGKTYFDEHIVRPLLACSGLIFQGAGATEPGVRGRIKHDSRPVLLDDIDGGKKDFRGNSDFDTIIEYMRQHCREITGSTVPKGGRDFVRKTFALRSMFMVTSINYLVKEPADLQRIIQARLTAASEVPDSEVNILRAKHFNEFVEVQRLALISQDNSTGFAVQANVARRLQQILDAIKVFITAVLPMVGKSQRLADSYGTLLAGSWVWGNTHVPTVEEAAAWVESIGKLRTIIASDENTSLSRKVLNAILMHQGQLDGGGQMPLGDAVQVVIDWFSETSKTKTTKDINDAIDRGLKQAYGSANNVAESQFNAALKLLNKHGLRIDWAGTVGYDGKTITLPSLLIGSSHAGLAEILKTSETSRNWNNVMRQLPLSRLSDSKDRKKWSNVPMSYLTVPLDVVMGDTETAMEKAKAALDTAISNEIQAQIDAPEIPLATVTDEAICATIH